MKKILLITIFSILFLAGCGTTSQPIVTHPIQVQPRACTEEAKLCPDGSAVGRTGPNCEFAKCPGEAKTYCTCPEWYRQDGEACNPACYYSTPKCLMPSVQCQ